jgi:hypothetical protein
VPGYIVLGAGKFGRLALARLGPGRFVVVDRSLRALTAARAAIPWPAMWVVADAAQWLAARLAYFAAWDWLIPMTPQHVAFECLRRTALAPPRWEMAPVPAAVAGLTTWSQGGGAGELYLSRADFVCPDDCPEPEAGCPVSGETRQPLHQELAALRLPGWQVHVLASRQLAPGVGGYPPGELLKLSKDLAQTRGRVIIATACRCHGVVHALARRPGG